MLVEELQGDPGRVEVREVRSYAEFLQQEKKC